jgi:iron(III) transport system substrate-binding protein
MHVSGTRGAVAVGAVAAMALLAACGGGVFGATGSDGQALVIYNGQRPATAQALASAFTKATGIKVSIRNGSDSQLAVQIEQEGSRSPADVIFAENSLALMALSGKGMLAKVPTAALAQIPTNYNSPRSDWIGVAGRMTVLDYNPSMVSASQLPASELDLADPIWKGKIAVAAAGTDFQAQLNAVIQSVGKVKAETWLNGLKRNAQVYQNNTAVVQAVNRGQAAAGLAFSSSWFRAHSESPDQTAHVELKYFGAHDPGAFLAVSGAGVLKSAKHASAADRFLQWLTGPQGQQELSTSKDYEYPLNPKAAAAPVLPRLSKLGVLDIPPAKLGDPSAAQQLLQQVGLI